VRAVPRGLSGLFDLGLVRVRVDDEFEVLRLGLALCPTRNPRGFARGQLRVEDGRGDTDTLLTAGLLAGVKARAVEELPEDFRDLFFRDAGTVVLDHELEVVVDLPDFDVDVGQDFGLLGRVEGVVDRLFDGGDEPPCARVEPEHVLVLLEELGDGYLSLAFGQLLGDILVSLAECRLYRGHRLSTPSVPTVKNSPLVR